MIEEDGRKSERKVMSNDKVWNVTMEMGSVVRWKTSLKMMGLKD